MDEEAAILAAVAAQPADELPRLAYADWLDDHADLLPDPEAARLRAEFVRVQCEIARVEHLPSPDLQRYADLYRRQDAILTDHRRDLLGPLADALGPNDAGFDRGFVADLDLTAAAFLAHAPAVAGLAPRPRVRVREAGLAFRELIERPEVACVTGLSVGTVARDFVLDPGHAGVLGSCRYFTRLEALSLEGTWLRDSGLEALLGIYGDDFPALVDLDLSLTTITDHGVGWLTRSWVWPRLTRLVLGGNEIGDEAADALADAAAGAAKLEYLNLRFTGITTYGQGALLRNFPRRTKLDLF